MKSVVIFLLLLFAGCARPRETGESTRKDIAGRLQYFKDRYGVCYAVIEADTSNPFINSVSITSVPCEKVGL